MATIVIKNIGKIEVDADKAVKVKNLYDDPKVSRDQMITIEGWSGKLSEIRSVFIESQKEDHTQFRKPHWVITNRKGDKIWSGVFLSFEDARFELDLQEISHGKNHPWFIEARN